MEQPSEQPMERLTAFEFVAADEHRPTLVQVKRHNVVLLAFMFVGWGAIILPASDPQLEFTARDELMIEGEGIARPYWNDEPTPWSCGFDPISEHQRIATVRAAVRREVNRVLLAV